MKYANENVSTDLLGMSNSLYLPYKCIIYIYLFVAVRDRSPGEYTKI